MAAGAPHGAAWTDGSSIFVDPDAEPALQRESLAVQAALLGAGSLDREMTTAVARRPALSRRYLAVEGHRALRVHEALLPPSVLRRIDWDVALRADSPAASLALAAGRDHIDDPPAVFGAIRPRHMGVGAASPPQKDALRPHLPRRGSDSELRQLDDAEDDVGPVIDLLSSPVGGGGGIGRLLKRLFGDTRSDGVGPPGADAPTHGSRRARGRTTSATLSSATAGLSDLAATGRSRSTKYPEWDGRQRWCLLKPDWCTGPGGRCLRGRANLALYVAAGDPGPARCAGSLGHGVRAASSSTPGRRY